MLQARAEAWRQARQSSDNLIIALEWDIRRNVVASDLSQEVMDSLGELGVDQLRPVQRRVAVFDRAASAQVLGPMLVLDAASGVVANSLAEPVQVDLTEREYFVVHRDRPDAGLYVSRPFYSSMRADKRTIALSRQLPGSDGAFRGIGVGALNVAYFDHLFERLNVGAGGVVTLTRTDGRMIARYPSDKDTFDRDISGSEVFRQCTTLGSGHYNGQAVVDGVTQLYTCRRVGDLPLVLSVGLSVAAINAEWLGHSVVVGGMLALLCMSSLALIILFRRELRLRLEAEQAMAERAHTLTVLAATDGLTGLSNRLAFDDALSRSWRQAARTRSSLALLLLDVDCFKLYNDRYGHRAGDQVLRSLAVCLKANLQRPLDVAARYGGEEFAVVLPDTSWEGALCVAESIRRAVAGFAIPHSGSPFGVVTVSLGVVAVKPVEREGELQLVDQADQALYEAKRRGRNCVTANTMMGEIHGVEPISGPTQRGSTARVSELCGTISELPSKYLPGSPQTGVPSGAYLQHGAA